MLCLTMERATATTELVAKTIIDRQRPKALCAYIEVQYDAVIVRKELVVCRQRHKTVAISDIAARACAAQVWYTVPTCLDGKVSLGFAPLSSGTERYS